MARGWESKSVEEQIEASTQAASEPAAPNKMNSEAARELANLRLARAQVAQSLTHAENARYRQQLEQALADLDARIAAQAKAAE